MNTPVQAVVRLALSCLVAVLLLGATAARADVRIALTPEAGMGWSSDTYTGDDTAPAGRFGASVLWRILPALPVKVWFSDTVSARSYLSQLSAGQLATVDEHRLDLGLNVGYDLLSLVDKLDGRLSLTPKIGFEVLLFNSPLYRSHLLGAVLGGELGVRLAERLHARVELGYLLGASQEDNTPSMHGPPTGSFAYRAALDIGFSRRFALSLAYAGETVAREHTFRHYHALLIGLQVGLLLGKPTAAKPTAAKN